MDVGYIGLLMLYGEMLVEMMLILWKARRRPLVSYTHSYNNLEIALLLAGIIIRLELQLHNSVFEASRSSLASSWLATKSATETCQPNVSMHVSILGGKIERSNFVVYRRRPFSFGNAFSSRAWLRIVSTFP